MPAGISACSVRLVTAPPTGTCSFENSSVVVVSLGIVVPMVSLGIREDIKGLIPLQVQANDGRDVENRDDFARYGLRQLQGMMIRNPFREGVSAGKPQPELKSDNLNSGSNVNFRVKSSCLFKQLTLKSDGKTAG